MEKVTVLRVLLVPIIFLILQLIIILKTIVVSIINFLTPSTTLRVVRTPETRFEGLEALGYTFKPNYVELPIGGGKSLPRVHYVDEGPRDAHETILCLHGEPSWSFLYRRMIPIFVKAGYRVIAPDFIGFGKSDKYTHPDSYTLDLHTQTLRLLLDHLKVDRLTLVCQDWGGKVGLTTLKDCPHLFSRLVIMNTNIPSGLKKSDLLNEIAKMGPFIVWQSISQVFGTYLPIKTILNVAFKRPTAEILNGYDAPHPSHLYKGGVAQWPILVPLTSTTSVATEFQETKDFLANEWKKQTFIMFGDGDAINMTAFEIFQKLLPNAPTKMISGAGHFIQEDKGEEVANNIVSFIDEKLQ